MRKLTLEEIKKRLEDINPDIEILSTEYINANTKLKCRCKIDGCVWYPTWGRLQQGGGCPECGKKSMANKQRYNLDKIKSKLKNINPNIEILSNEYKNNQTKLHCKCLIDGYEWYATWNKLQQGRGCPECGGVRTDYTIDDIKTKLKLVNPNIEILSNEYIDAVSKLKCRCLIDNHIWYASWRNLQTGKGCPICGNGKISKAKRLCLDIKKDRLNKINPNMKVLGERFEDGKSLLKCECLIDGYIWESLWNNLSHGQGCPECKNRNTGDRCRLTLDEVKEEIYNINPNIKILSDKYESTHTKMKCKCLKCGYEWETIRSILRQGCGCPRCNNSKGEKAISVYLEDSNIRYIQEYSFKDLLSVNDVLLRFDFYLPKHNICIEYDGIQHFEPVDFFGGEEQFNNQKHNDKLKNTYCRNNNIGLLRIPYWDYDNIDDILDKYINNVLKEVS